MASRVAAGAGAPRRAAAGGRPAARTRAATRARTRRRDVVPRVKWGDDEPPSPSASASVSSSISQNARLRSEAEAPFRVFRLVSYAALAGSAGIGTAIATVRSIAGLVKGDILWSDVSGWGIDVAALSLFLYLYRIENKARDKQIDRLERESRLSCLKVRINFKDPKVLPLERLQGFARVVVVHGSRAYILASLAEAAEVQDGIKDRSICIVPVVSPGAGGGTEVLREEEMLAVLPNPTVLLSPVLVDQWVAWVAEQKQVAGVDADQDVYVGLRMDGRVRASGKGKPPWKKFIAELTPKEGIWGTQFMSGFDGRV